MQEEGKKGSHNHLLSFLFSSFHLSKSLMTARGVIQFGMAVTKRFACSGVLAYSWKKQKAGWGLHVPYLLIAGLPLIVL